MNALRQCVDQAQHAFYASILKQLAAQSGAIRMTCTVIGMKTVVAIMARREMLCFDQAQQLDDASAMNVAKQIHAIQRHIKLMYNPINFDHPAFLQERVCWVKWRGSFFSKVIQAYEGLGDAELTYEALVKAAYQTQAKYQAFIKEQNYWDDRCFAVTLQAAHPWFKKPVKKQTDLSQRVMAEAFQKTVTEIWSQS